MLITLEEAKEIIQDAGMALSDEEFETVNGGVNKAEASNGGRCDEIGRRTERKS